MQRPILPLLCRSARALSHQHSAGANLARRYSARVPGKENVAPNLRLHAAAGAGSNRSQSTMAALAILAGLTLAGGAASLISAEAEVVVPEIVVVAPRATAKGMHVGCAAMPSVFAQIRARLVHRPFRLVFFGARL